MSDQSRRGHVYGLPRPVVVMGQTLRWGWSAPCRGGRLSGWAATWADAMAAVHARLADAAWVDERFRAALQRGADG